MKVQKIIYKALRHIFFNLSFTVSSIITKIKFWLNGVKVPSKMIAKGIPIINVSMHGNLEIGNRFHFNSGLYYNMIGRQQKLILIVAFEGNLKIGANVGISCSTIVCHNKVTIGNDVRIGGNCVIYDTDFHDLNVINRTSEKEDLSMVKSKPVIIEDGVFIGAHSTILKGVKIGSNSVIGAGSVVSKDIPANEVWAGNPAKYIKDLC